jgi:hypothetical protein
MTLLLRIHIFLVSSLLNCSQGFFDMTSEMSYVAGTNALSEFPDLDFIRQHVYHLHINVSIPKLK